MAGFLIGRCESCDALVLDEISNDAQEFVICKGCGAKLCAVSGRGTIVKGKIWRSGMSKAKGLLAIVQLAFRSQRNRNGLLVRHERLIDRRANRYFEQVSAYDSGEVIHHCDEPLTEHRGHGTARKPHR